MYILGERGFNEDFTGDGIWFKPEKMNRVLTVRGRNPGRWSCAQSINQLGLDYGNYCDLLEHENGRIKFYRVRNSYFILEETKSQWCTWRIIWCMAMITMEEVKTGLGNVIGPWGCLMDHTYLQPHTVKNGIFYPFVMSTFTYILVQHFLAILVLGTYPREMRTHVQTNDYTQMFSAALIINARTLKQPKWTSTSEWINKLCFICIVETSWH